jgi:hypothetical protein
LSPHRTVLYVGQRTYSAPRAVALIGAASATFAQDAAPIALTLTPSANGPLGVYFQREVSRLFLGTFSLTPYNVGARLR